MSVKCLIYCSKAKPYLSEEMIDPPFIENKFCLNVRQDINHNRVLNGKIVASFDCEKVEEFTMDYRGNEEQNKRIVKDSCVPLGDLVDYQKENHLLYAIHISNLEIFDEPKELGDYLVFDGDYTDTDNWKTNQYAPQNMKNVYEFCSSNDVISPKRTLKKCVLISIKPEWVVKILNGEKTIEVRKQVVNKLKELI